MNQSFLVGRVMTELIERRAPIVSYSQEIDGIRVFVVNFQEGYGRHRRVRSPVPQSGRDGSIAPDVADPGN